MNRKTNPLSFEVLSVNQVTPNMRNVSLGGDAMAAFPRAQDGGYIKLIMPEAGPGAKPTLRTYTIRRQLADRLDVEFALHGADGTGGPAVEWASSVQPGEAILVGGPGPAKPLVPGADQYFVVGDMTALPAIAVNLAKLSADTQGQVIIEVRSARDEQPLIHPSGVGIHWVHNADPGHNADAFEQVVRSIPWPAGRVYSWSATEFSMMRRMRTYLREERRLGKDQLYLSSYWKMGATEDAHKVVKREDAMMHAED